MCQGVRRYSDNPDVATFYMAVTMLPPDSLLMHFPGVASFSMAVTMCVMEKDAIEGELYNMS